MLLVCVDVSSSAHCGTKQLVNLEAAHRVDTVDQFESDRTVCVALIFHIGDQKIRVTDPAVIRQFQTLPGCDFRDCPKAGVIS